LQGTSRKLFHLLASVVALALLDSTAKAGDECMATLEDPNGSANVIADGIVVATIKADEHFLARINPADYDRKG
jgi:hypothetical protein